MTKDLKDNIPLFAVNILYRSLRDGEFAEVNLWEESIVLIDAGSEAEAEAKATAIALSRQSSYISSDGKVVTWLFYKVERVFEILELPLQHGSELFSRYLRNSEVQSLMIPFD